MDQEQEVAADNNGCSCREPAPVGPGRLHHPQILSKIRNLRHSTASASRRLAHGPRDVECRYL